MNDRELLELAVPTVNNANYPYTAIRRAIVCAAAEIGRIS
jgi:hypothetical protein